MLAATIRTLLLYGRGSYSHIVLPGLQGREAPLTVVATVLNPEHTPKICNLYDHILNKQSL